MEKSTTCSVEDCGKRAHSRGWCSSHYMRWNRYGDPLASPPAKDKVACSVKTCDREAFARGWCRAHYSRWAAHGDPREGVPIQVVGGACQVAGCESRHEAKGYCQGHYRRFRLYGDPLASAPRVNEGPCSVEGCDSPARKRTWCASHYSQWAREGAVRPFRYKWRDERGACDSCGQQVPDGSATRRFCSPSCVRIFYANGGVVSADAECRRCGEKIDRRPDGERGWIRDDVLMCRSCRHARTKRYGASASELAKRDGTDCSLCGKPVDMSLTRADGVMCASVDHVYPYSLGGSNDAENLALAHLKCNQLKLNRVGWTVGADAI